MRRRRSFRQVTVESLEHRSLLSTITVTSLADNTTADGQVTLREAVEAANTDTSVDGSSAGHGADTIRFADGLTGTIKMSNALLVTSSLTVRGHGVGLTRLDGQTRRRIFRVSRAAGEPPVDFQVEDLALLNATSIKDGPAIQALGRETAVALRRVKVTNSSSAEGAVQVLAKDGQLTIESSEFVGNIAAEAGGALSVGGDGLAFEVIDSVFRENTAADGGAIRIGSGVSGVIRDSLFEQNAASRDGGAIEARNQAEIVVRDSDFLSNTAGRGGGGIYANKASDAAIARVDVFASSFVGNSADAEGGAIRVYEGSIHNTTVSGNTAERAAVFRADVLNSTVVNNIGGSVGGIFGGSRAARVESSIVAGNSGTIPDLRLGTIQVDRSLIGDKKGTSLSPGSPNPDGSFVGTAAGPIDPKLLPLMNFGRGSKVHALRPDSPAVDTGANASGLATDQRGADRTSGTDPDIGAFEGTLRGMLTISNPQVVEGDTGTRYLRFRISFVGQSGPAFSVDVSTRDGSAAAGSDFGAVVRTVNFHGREQTRVVSVPVIADQIVEATEYMTLRIDRVSTPDIRITGSGRGQITTDDTNASIVLANGTLTVKGTDTADVIRIFQSDSHLRVTANEKERELPLAVVEHIVVRAGSGHDVVKAGQVSVDMEVHGAAGNDTIYTGSGDDFVLAGSGNDSVRASSGNDSVDGGLGNDSLWGDLGNDSLLGGEGADSLLGESGRDNLRGGLGRDRLLGGADTDDLAGGSDKDTLLGGRGNDLARGDAGDDVLQGGGGRDTLLGGSGSDTMSGGGGNDVMDGGVSDDVLAGDNGADSIIGGADDDVLFGDRGADTLRGSHGQDLLVGGFVNLPGRSIADVRDTIHLEWALGKGYDSQVANIRRDHARDSDLAHHLVGRDRSENQTAFNDSRSDVLTGAQGRDYFFVTLNGGAGDIFDADDNERREII